jgi:hypothetical protein
VSLLLGHHCLFDAGPEAFDLVRAVVHLNRLGKGKPPISFFLINSAESFWKTVFIYKFTFLLFFTVPRGWSETFSSNKKQKWLQTVKASSVWYRGGTVCLWCMFRTGKVAILFWILEYLFNTVVSGFQTETWFRFLHKNNIIFLSTGVPDPWHFDTDPDPARFGSGIQDTNKNDFF